MEFGNSVGTDFGYFGGFGVKMVAGYTNNDKFQEVDINTVGGVDTEDFLIFEYDMHLQHGKKIEELFERFTSYLEIMIAMRSLD